MRLLTFAIATLSLLFAASSAQAGASCSTFATITGYDEAASSITMEKAKGNEGKFFPKTEGAPKTSKLPKRCKSKVLGQDTFPVKPTGGRMSITQVRANFSGKMLNDVDDKTWVGKQIQEIVKSGEVVVVVLRQPPGAAKDAPHDVTTIYMPITEAEIAEIARLDAQVSDDE